MPATPIPWEISAYWLGKGAPHLFIELGIFGKLLDALAHLLTELIVTERRA
jgi:hypothetical protein